MGIKQANMSYADQEVVLMSKDNTEYKVKFGIAMASETIKALSSFPEEEEDQEDWSVPDAPIPLPKKSFAKKEPALPTASFCRCCCCLRLLGHPGSGLRQQFLALLLCLLNASNHVEGVLRKVIVHTLKHVLEGLDGFLKVDVLAGSAGEDLSDLEGLRHEALDLAPC